MLVRKDKDKSEETVSAEIRNHLQGPSLHHALRNTDEPGKPSLRGAS